MDCVLCCAAFFVPSNSSSVSFAVVECRFVCDVNDEVLLEGSSTQSSGSVYHSVFDLTHLKAKERDELLSILQFWKAQPLSDNKTLTLATSVSSSSSPSTSTAAKPKAAGTRETHGD